MKNTLNALSKMRLLLFQKVWLIMFFCIFLMGFAKFGYSTSFEYADTDLVALETDIEAGTYDEYILSTSGGNYELLDILFGSNVTIKAKDGLVDMPIISMASNAVASKYFFTTSGAFTITLEGIKFNGAATSPIAAAVRLNGVNANANITNCEFYNFTLNSGVIRLDQSGVSLTMDSSYVHDCYGRAIRITNSPVIVGGDITLTNTTFANITNDPVIHWVTTATGSLGNITVDQCTFYDISNKVFSLGTLTGNLTITNSIFDAATGTITIGTTGTSSTIDYCYTTGLTGTLDTDITETNSIATAPTYVDAGTLDLNITNAWLLTGSTGGPIGDVRWVQAASGAVEVYNNVQSINDGAGQFAVVQSNKDTGKVYIILDGETQITEADFTTAVSADKGAVANVTAAYTNTSLAATGLAVGDYYAYAVDGGGLISTKGANTITIASSVAPVTVLNAIQTEENGVGKTVTIQSNKTSGTVYIILDGETQATIADLDNAVTAKKGASASVTAADTDIPVSVTGIAVGTYYAYAVEGANLSTKGTNAITITKAPPVVSAATQRATNASGQLVNVQSSDADGKVYIIHAGEAQATVGELDAAVVAQKGSSAVVAVANTDVAVSTENLAPGIYYAYAVDGLGNMSTKGTAMIGVASTTITEKEYSDTDAETLVNEIEMYLYQTYILSTSGGDYVVKDIDLAANTVIKSKAGLVALPKFTNATNATTFTAFFDIQTGAYSLEVNGIIFDGTATEPMIGVARLRANNAIVNLKNCEVKNFTTNNGFVRLDNAGNAISIDSCFVHDCYGRLIRINSGGVEFGDVIITNSTFANITTDPVIHWVTASSSTVNTIEIDQCNFYNINNNVFKLGTILQPVLVTNSIFDLIADSTEFFAPGSADSINYSYVAGFGKQIPNYFKVTNSIVTTPLYTDGPNLNFNLTNPDFLLGSSGAKPIGDPRWHNLAASPILAIYNAQSATNATGQGVQLKSNKAAGFIYIILDGEVQVTISDFDAAVTANKGAKASITSAYTNIAISTVGLAEGTYYAYAVDVSNAISVKGANAITVLDATIPVAVLNEVQAVTNAAGQVVQVQSNKPEGTVYIVLDGVAQSSLAELNAAIAANKADSATVTANDVDINVPADSLALGLYYAYAVDADGNISPKGTNAITIVKGSPVVYADAQSVTDAAGQFALIQSSDNHGKVYIILEGELQDSIPAFQAAVAAGKGAVDTVIASLTNVQVSTQGLAVGIYYAYATDSVGNVSAKGGNKITVTSSTITSKEYADTEAAQLVADIEAALYETFILSTSGGNYVVTDIDLAANTVVKAKEGLAAMPKFTNTSNTATFQAYFDIQNGAYSLEVDGIIFDGTASEPMIGVARLRVSNASINLKNCEIKNFATANGFVRLDNTGNAISMDNCFVHDCYGRLIRINNNGSAMGNISLSNSTFANVTTDPVIHWVTASSSTANKVTINQCNFYNINNNVFKLGTLTEPLLISNSIFDAVKDSMEFFAPGTTDSINYCYVNGLGANPPAALVVTNSVETAPVYTDAVTLNLSLTNQSFLIGSDGITPIGDPRWHESGPVAVMVVYDAQSLTNAAGQEVLAMSNKNAGFIYIILDGEAQSTLVELDAAILANKGAKATVTAANTTVAISAAGLIAGTYYAYAVDGDNAISAKGTNAIIVLDAAIPVAISNAVQTVSNAKDQIAKVQSNKPEGTVYIVLDGVAQATLAELNAAVASNNADSATVTANNVDINIPTDSLALGMYYAYAVDAEGNISPKGTNAITIVKGAPEVYADAQSVTDAAGQFAQVQSSDNHGKVYIILDGESQDSIPAFEAAVAAGKGNVAIVTASLTNVELSTAGLAVGVYYAYATDSVGNVSAKGSNKIIVLSSTSFAKEYADTEIDALAADITAGLYEMYVLTTSGGNYDLPQIPDISKNAVIMAKPGLAAKPVLKCSANISTAFGVLRVRNAIATVDLLLQGLEFDCTGSVGNVLRSDSKTNLVVRDCYVHHNTNSNGSFRLNSAESTVVMENCLVSNCSQRVINLYTNTVNYGDITLSNCTFVKLAGEGVVFFRSSGSYAGGEDVTINHCTFSQIGGNIFRFDKAMISGSVSVTNSLFDQVADTINADVLDYNFLDVAKLTADAGTNRFATVPVFVDSASNNYGLSNKADYVCGDGETVGDLSWYVKADSLIAILYPQSTTNGVGSKIKAQANVASGKIYIIRKGEPATTIAELNSAVDANKGDSASIVAIYTHVEISVNGLKSGAYYAYVVGANGVISSASEFAANILDGLNIQYEAQIVTNGIGKTVTVTTSFDGFAYLVKEGDYSTVADLDAAVAAYRGAKMASIASVPVNIPVTGLQVGTYYGYAVADTTVSVPGDNAITINTAIYVDNKAQTVANQEGNWSHAYAKAGTVGGWVYLLNDATNLSTVSIDDLEKAVAENNAVKDTVKVAEVDFKVSTAGLNAGTYHFYLVLGNQISAQSNAAVTVRTPKVYYYSAEQAEDMRKNFYNATITTGDEVILTTSGGVYNLKTYFRIYGGVYLHAQEGLAEKPVLFYNPASGNEDVRFFMPLIEFYPPSGLLQIKGIEFDGGAIDQISGNATFGIRVREDAEFNYNIAVAVDDCYFHDFNTENINSAGVVSVEGYAYRQSNNAMADSVVFTNCIVKNTNKPAIYFRNITNTNYFNSLQITNATFVNAPAILQVSSPLADSKSVVSINHCTFDSIGENVSTSRLVVPNNLNYLNMANSIISYSASQVATDTALVVFGDSKLTNCNTFKTAFIASVGGSQVSNTTTLNPNYYNRAAFNYAPKNASLLAAGIDGLQLGDLRWSATDDLKVNPVLRFVSNTELKLIFSQVVDTVTALTAANYTLSGTVGLIDNPNSVRMSAPNQVILTLTDFSQAADFATIVVNVVNVTNVLGNVVKDSDNSASYIIPIAVVMNEQMVANEAGATVEATCGSVGGSIYLVPENAVVFTVNDLINLVDSGYARKAVVTQAMIMAQINVENLEPGVYYAYAADADESKWSNRSTNSATIRGLEVEMPIQLGKTNAPDETVTVVSTYLNATVYLVADSIEVTSIGDLELAVANNDGAQTDVLEAFANLSISIEGINAGRYRAYAVSGDSISEKSKVPVQIDQFIDNSINEIEGLKVYSFEDYAYIEMNDFVKAKLSIYSVSGAVILHQQLSSTRTQIQLEPGVYIITVVTSTKINTSKVTLR